MGSYAVAMGAIAAILSWSGQREAQDLVLKFLEHFAGIRASRNSTACGQLSAAGLNSNTFPSQLLLFAA
jgi:hypothetical protein